MNPVSSESVPPSWPGNRPLRIDTGFGALESASAAAIAAQNGGFDGLYSGEVSSDPFLPLALAAEVTDRIELGTSIAVAFARSPMTLAYTAWDLQRFSRGRFVLGLGTQVKAHVRRRFDMPWGRPATQMRDFVLALRAVWESWSTGAPLAFESEHYRHSLMPPTFVPPANPYGPPKILLAGVGEAMTTTVAEVADGFLCHGFTTERWIRERTIPALVDGRSRVGRTLDDFTVKAAIYLATGTEEEIAVAVEQIKTHIAFYASTPSYRPVLELHGWSEVGAQLTVLSKTGRWAEMPKLITDEMVSAFALVGPPQDIPAQLRSRCAGVIDRVSFLVQEPTADLMAALRS